MGGPKQKGQITHHGASPGLFKTKTADINFVVSYRRVLADEHNVVENNGSGILCDMIDKVSQYDPDNF